MKRLFTFFVLALMTISVSAQSAWGDLNNDGEVNTSDVTVLYNVIFGTDTDTDATTCDINGDGGTPNTSDVTALYNIIFGTAQ